MQVPVTVLNANTKRETGKKAQDGNIAAAKVWPGPLLNQQDLQSTTLVLWCLITAAGNLILARQHFASSLLAVSAQYTGFIVSGTIRIPCSSF